MKCFYWELRTNAMLITDNGLCPSVNEPETWNFVNHVSISALRKMVSDGHEHHGHKTRGHVKNLQSDHVPDTLTDLKMTENLHVNESSVNTLG